MRLFARACGTQVCSSPLLTRRHVSLSSSLELDNWIRLAKLMPPEERRQRQAQATARRRAASLQEAECLQPDRCTPGARIPVNYLSGTNAVTHWEPFFADLYAATAGASSTSSTESLRPTAPLYECPFCPSRTAALADGSGSRASPRWRTPLEMRNHLNLCHASAGVSPVELRDYNDAVIGQLAARACVEPASGTRETRDSANVHMPRAHKMPLRAIVLVDTANIELSCPDMLLSLVQTALTSSGVFPSSSPADKSSPSLFSLFPIAFCCVHELFIPHTAKTPHALYQLAQEHRDSDFFTFYASNRLEAGDLTTAWVIGALRDALRGGGPSTPPRQSSCPPIIVLTMDAQQKQCLTELFGEGIAPLGVADGPVLCPRFLNEASILHALRDAIDSTLEA